MDYNKHPELLRVEGDGCVLIRDSKHRDSDVVHGSPTLRSWPANECYDTSAAPLPGRLRWSDVRCSVGDLGLTGGRLSQ